MRTHHQFCRLNPSNSKIMSIPKKYFILCRAEIRYLSVLKFIVFQIDAVPFICTTHQETFAARIGFAIVLILILNMINVVQI